jgi:hypothetical protein
MWLLPHVRFKLPAVGCQALLLSESTSSTLGTWYSFRNVDTNVVGEPQYTPPLNQTKTYIIQTRAVKARVFVRSAGFYFSNWMIYDLFMSGIPTHRVRVVFE